MSNTTAWIIVILLILSLFCVVLAMGASMSSAITNCSGVC